MAFQVGMEVQTIASTGLRARLAPNGPLVLQADKTPLVRPKGFRFVITQTRDGWSKAKSHWYSDEYLRVVPPPPPRVSSPAPGSRVSTPFGKKPNNDSYWQARGHHTGDDYAAPSGAKVIAVRPGQEPREVANGASMLIDVEHGPHGKLYGLAQGQWDGVGEGSRAEPDTGRLVVVGRDGDLTPVVDGHGQELVLDRPTSVEFVGATAYVVSVTGDVYQVDGL